MKLKFVFVLCFLIGGIFINNKVFAQTVKIIFNDGSTATGELIEETSYSYKIEKANGVVVEMYCPPFIIKDFVEVRPPINYYN